MPGRVHTAPRLDPEAFADAIRGRRTINFFEPQPVDRGILLEAVEIARWAPNHGLTEPWRFYLIGPQTAEDLARLAADLDTAAKGEKAGAARLKRMHDIPGFFVLTSKLSGNAVQEREDYAACCCAAQNLMLYLWQRGIGVKWTTGAITREQAFYDLLGIDAEAEMVVGFFWYGIPKIVTAQKRREVEEIVTERP
jgi:nitroreductase